MKKFILILLIGFFASCVAKKESTSLQIDVKKDSVSEVKMIIIIIETLAIVLLLRML